MLNLITIDDERYFHQGLDKLVDWKEFNITRIGEAYNGEAGYELILKNKPDIIMTDIRMPVIDGLELIGKVAEIENYNPEWIILSGYDNFIFAKKAMQFGVKYYLLKPVDENELKEILSVINSGITKMNHFGDADPLERRLAVSAVIRRIVSYPSNIRAIEKARKILKISGPINYIQIVLDEDVSADIENLLRKNLKKLRAESASEFITIFSRQMYGFLLTENDRMFEDPLKLSRKLYKMCQGNLNCRVFIAIGKQVGSLDNLYESYSSAQIALNQILFNPQSTVMLAAEAENSESAPVFGAAREILFFPELISGIEQNNMEEINCNLDRIFDSILSRNMNKADIKIWINCLVIDISRIVLELDGKLDDDIRKFHQLSLSDRFISSIEYREKVQKFCVSSALRIEKLRKLNKTGIIMVIMDYIKANYYKQVSLKELGGRFSLNPVYLGQLFRNSLGISYKRYLLETRINEAKKLLSKTDLKVYEVAKSVGYSDSDYFSEKFVEITGKTPGAYRKN